MKPSHSHLHIRQIALKFAQLFMRVNLANMRLAHIFYQFERLWWWLTRPVTIGVRLLAVQDGSVLLVRHTYQQQWYLPGGGVKRGETLEQAIRREAAEEVGATLGELRLSGVYTNFYEYKSDHVVVFVCDDVTLSGATDREIERFTWSAFDDLPLDTSPGSRKRIAEYCSRPAAPIVAHW
jgi:8-oxo-dGTP pyrophosphatase MutT (NUDIX family)